MSEEWKSVPPMTYDPIIAQSHTHWLSVDEEILIPCPLEATHGKCLGRGRPEESAAKEIYTWIKEPEMSITPTHWPWCRFGWHAWGRWEQYEREVLWSPGRIAPKALQGQWHQGIEERQRRTCRACGRKEDEEVRESL